MRRAREASCPLDDAESLPASQRLWRRPPSFGIWWHSTCHFLSRLPGASRRRARIARRRPIILKAARSRWRLVRSHDENVRAIKRKSRIDGRRR